MTVEEFRVVLNEVLEKFGNLDIILIGEGSQEQLSVETLRVSVVAVDGVECLALITADLDAMAGPSADLAMLQ